MVMRIRVMRKRRVQSVVGYEHQKCEECGGILGPEELGRGWDMSNIKVESVVGYEDQKSWEGDGI